MKKKILIDIDVVSVAKYYVNDKDYTITKPFVDRAESGEFEMHTPYTLLEVVSRWKDGAVKKKVLDFYYLFSTEILSIEKVTSRFNELKIRREKLIPIFEKHGIKEEDATLVLIASSFQLKLITLNRKHLWNRREEINKILKENGLDEIEIMLPNEI